MWVREGLAKHVCVESDPSVNECGDLKLGGHRRSAEAPRFVAVVFVRLAASLLASCRLYFVIDLIKMYIYANRSYLGQLGGRRVQHLFLGHVLGSKPSRRGQR